VTRKQGVSPPSATAGSSSSGPVLRESRKIRNELPAPPVLRASGGVNGCRPRITKRSVCPRLGVCTVTVRPLGQLSGRNSHPNPTARLRGVGSPFGSGFRRWAKSTERTVAAPSAKAFRSRRAGITEQTPAASGDLHLWRPLWPCRERGGTRAVRRLPRGTWDGRAAGSRAERAGLVH
jgi:hypothetical protein